MTLAELRTKADAKLAQFWTVLVQKQTAYHAKHGKFFQLLASPETPVVDGVDSTFTVRNPSDEKYVVDVDFPWTDLVPFNIQVSEYVSNTQGFVASVVVELPNGRKFTRSRSYELQPDLVTNPDPGNPDTEVRTSQNPVQVDSGWSEITNDE